MYSYLEFGYHWNCVQIHPFRTFHRFYQLRNKKKLKNMSCDELQNFFEWFSSNEKMFIDQMLGHFSVCFLNIFLLPFSHCILYHSHSIWILTVFRFAIFINSHDLNILLLFFCCCWYYCKLHWMIWTRKDLFLLSFEPIAKRCKSNFVTII